MTLGKWQQTKLVLQAIETKLAFGPGLKIQVLLLKEEKLALK